MTIAYFSSLILMAVGGFCITFVQSQLARIGIGLLMYVAGLLAGYSVWSPK